MKSLFTRLSGLAFLLVALAVVAAACGTGIPERGSGLKGSAKDEIVKVANVTDSTSPYASINVGILEYMIIHAFHYHVEIVDVTSANLEQALKDGTVHVAIDVPGSESWLGGAGINDYGVVFTSADGVEFHKAVNPGLETLTPDLAVALQKMEIPERRYAQIAEWQVEFSVTDREKVAVYYFWEFDFTDGSFKAWMEFDPWDDIRVNTQTVTRLIRGTEYKGADLVKD
ncbi:MAG: hypothetical protein O2854_05730 [Chloroflexi bacterium]|nr:hypothetical protein [Chloroflexota bacterium]